MKVGKKNCRPPPDWVAKVSKQPLSTADRWDRRVFGMLRDELGQCGMTLRHTQTFALQSFGVSQCAIAMLLDQRALHALQKHVVAS